MREQHTPKCKYCKVKIPTEVMQAHLTVCEERVKKQNASIQNHNIDTEAPPSELTIVKSYTYELFVEDEKKSLKSNKQLPK